MKMSKDEEKFFNENVIDFSKKSKAKDKADKAKNLLGASKLYKLKPNEENDFNTSGYRYWFPKVKEVRVSSMATRLIEEAHMGNMDDYMQYLMHLLNVGSFGLTDHIEDSRNMFAIANGGIVTGKYPYDPDMDFDKVGADEILLISISKCRTMCFVALESEVDAET